MARGRNILKFAAAAAALALAAPAAAQAPGLDQLWVQCTNPGWAIADEIAVSACTEIINSGRESNENVAIAHFNRGNANTRLTTYPAALADYDRALEIGLPETSTATGSAEASLTRADALAARGIVYHQMRDYERALSDLNEAIRINPNLAAAYGTRGDVYQFGQQKYQEAVADYDRALAIRPDARDHASRGTAYHYGLQDLDRALADYDSALALNPSHDVRVDRGNIYYARGDYRAAIVEYDAAIAAIANYTAAFFNRGNARSWLGDTDGAVADWTRAIEIDANYADALGNRGEVYRDRGQYDQALVDLDRALAVRVNAADSHTRGRIYADGFRDSLRAIADYDRAVELEPVNADYNNSACWERAVAERELDVARARCDAAIAVDGQPSWYDSRGLVGLKQGRFQDAWNDYDVAVRGDATIAHFLYGRGIAALRLGRGADGQADIAAAAALQADIAQVYERYGVTR